jgi:hypothetical protein
MALGGFPLLHEIGSAISPQFQCCVTRRVHDFLRASDWRVGNFA